jgi:mono/diheme cytochrome c family protein
MKMVFVVVSMMALVACAAYKPLTPTQSDADRAAKSNPSITLANLNEGKTIFETKCHKCHSLKKPFNDKSEDELRAALPIMGKRAKLDSRQEDLVLQYLLTMTTKP